MQVTDLHVQYQEDPQPDRVCILLPVSVYKFYGKKWMSVSSHEIFMVWILIAICGITIQIFYLQKIDVSHTLQTLRGIVHKYKKEC